MSDENTADEVIVTFSADKNKGEKVRDFLRKEGEKAIRPKLAEYIRLLKEEFSQGLILPTKNSEKTNSSTTNKTTTSPVSVPSVTPKAEPAKKTLELKDLQVQEYFICSKSEIFRTFCDFDRVKAFTQNSVSAYDCKKGGFFSLLSDNISGRFLNISPNDRLDLLWRFKSWPSEHFSFVSISFHDEIDRTKVIVNQTGVPVQFYENTIVKTKKSLLSQRKFLFLLSGWLETILFRKYKSNFRLRFPFVLT